VKTSHYLIASLGGARERSVPLLKEEKRGWRKTYVLNPDYFKNL
jgi:hypothetical protein